MCRAAPARHAAYCVVPGGIISTSWEGASDPGEGQSQISAFRLIFLHKCRSLPSACFSKFASPNVRRRQEESVSLPRGEKSCQAVPRSATSLCSTTAGPSLCSSASFQCCEAACPLQQQEALCSPLLHPWRKDGEKEEKSEVQVSMLKGVVQHSTPLLHGMGCAGS